MVRSAKTSKGKKKADYPPIPCKGCKISFVPKDRRQRFHSEMCREDYYQRTYFSKNIVNKTCPNCDTVFTTSKPGRQTYCTPECREDAHRKRKEGLAVSMTAERKTFLGDRFAAMEGDNFRCAYCGKGVQDGVKLDVEDDGKGGLRTVCNMCAEGREFNAASDTQK